MELRKIFIAGLSVLAMASCSDYLDVEAPSKNGLDYAYSDKTEISRALNGVYASLLSNNTFGNRFINTFCLNSDVEFYINQSEYSQSNQYRRFDCDADGSELASSWATVYQGIERANILIDQLPQSELYMTVNTEGEQVPDADMSQMLGEARVIRAILYHELTWMFGDVPFSMEPSYDSEMVMPVVDRTVMLRALIDDLKDAADGMKFASELTEGVERISREMCWAMIARLSMTAGGYSLRPDGDTYGRMTRPDNYLEFYQTAIEYAGRVIDSGKHHLTKPYYRVFYDECNFIVDSNDDPIFEIPMGRESTGQIGYIHGPAMESESATTPHPYGVATGNARLNALYRYSFDENDVRRGYVNMLWKYTQTNEATLFNDRTVYNGKWSKLWVNGGLGAQSAELTGINYPYMRYTDVLLTFAEAVNEVENGLNGPNGAKARQAIAQVRSRAFPEAPDMVDPYISTRTDKQAALQMILNERKWEFAGENMRWRDLVRNNLYGLHTYWTFYRYYSVAETAGSSSDNLEYVSMFDFGDPTGYDNLPFSLYYKDNQVNNEIWPVSTFPNTNVNVVDILNPYAKIPSTDTRISKGKYKKAEFMNWYSENDAMPSAHFRNSLYGYIYCGTNGTVYINNNGTYAPAPAPSANPTAESLPVLRYLMPYPRTVITHSNSQYTNSYGYR